MRGVILSTTFLSLAINTIVGSATATKPQPNIKRKTISNLSKRASGVTSNVNDAAWQTYDYVVVGGGLTGITVASRLSEDPNTSVLIIETGQDNRFDDLVQNVYTYSQTFGTDLDWAWPADNGIVIRGGKTLGGSSSINGAAWTRGLDAQYDAWSTLLATNETSLNWNWNSLFSYMKKAETWSGPNDQQRAKGADGIDDYHGSNGPVQVTFPDLMFGGPQQGYFVQSIQNVTGIAKCRDLNGGNPNCVSFTPNNLNWHDNDYRSTAPAAYLTPVESSRTNWLTLVNHHVIRLLWTTDNSKFAYGVRFKQSDNTGDEYEVYVRKEVIVAAGAINTPAVLQRSGVGDPAHLSGLGIDTVLNIPTVGKNLQEQTMTSLGANGNGFDPQGSGPSDCIAFPNLYELFGQQGNATATEILQGLAGWADAQKGSALSKEALQKIYNVQADLIVNKNAPVVELFFDTGFPAPIGVDLWPLLPFSRGTVQIGSTDAFQKPQIQVNYFSVDIDLKIQVQAGRTVRKLFQTPPLSSLSTGEAVPGFDRVPNGPNGGSDSDWQNWVTNNFASVHHPIATCAMMRQELGGVVDGRLRLYGSQNVRIVDASIVPLQFSGHLSSTLYGVAEKVADMIKNGV